MSILQQFNITSIALIELDTSAGSSSYALPDITPFQQGVLVKDATGNAAANNVTITPPSGLLIDGAATYALTTNYQSALFVSDGARIIVHDGTGVHVPGTITGRLTVNLNAAAVPDPAPLDSPVRTQQTDTHANLTINFAYGNVAGFVGARADGTGASPTRVLQNAHVAAFGAAGYCNSGWVFGLGGMSVFAAEDWSFTSLGTYLTFDTVPLGLDTSLHRVLVYQDGGVLIQDGTGANPTGDSKGAGTINAATAYYIAGVNLAGNLPATLTNDDAAAGHVGEFVSASVANGSAVALTTGTAANVTSINLTPGDWDIEAQIEFKGGATTTLGQVAANIGTASATVSDAQSGFVLEYYGGATIFGSVSEISQAICRRRASLSAPATYYLNAFASFGVSTCSAYGGISARRVR